MRSKSLIPLIRYALHTGFNDIVSMQSLHRAVQVDMSAVLLYCTLESLLFVEDSWTTTYMCQRRKTTTTRVMMLLCCVCGFTSTRESSDTPCRAVWVHAFGDRSLTPVSIHGQWQRHSLSLYWCSLSDDDRSLFFVITNKISAGSRDILRSICRAPQRVLRCYSEVIALINIV